MRIAGQPDVQRRLLADVGADNPASGDGDLGAFLDLYALLQSKGYSDQAAQQTAQAMVQGLEPRAAMTRRFAGIQGLPLPES